MQFKRGAVTLDFNTAINKGARFPVSVRYKQHQNVGQSESGKITVGLRQVRETFIDINIIADHEIIDDIRNFIFNEAQFIANPFTFTPDPGFNAGNGDGQDIIVRYFDDNFIENQTSYHRYEYKLTLRVDI